MRAFIAELKRRNVLRAGVLYVGATWALAQGISQLSPSIGLPEGATRWFLIAAALGFPIAMLLSWWYVWTPGGLIRETEAPVAADIASSPAMPVAAPPTASIAVLPFADMSQDKDQEYFSDGLAEELINLLAKVPGLHVAGRTSSFSFKGKDAIITNVGRALNVATVLEGSVRKFGDHIRITAQLIKVADDFHLWSETWDRQLTDIFAIQDEIAAAVVETLKLKLMPGELPSAIRHHTPGPEAYSQYLLGRHHLNRGTPAGFARAVEAYSEAMKLEPGYALAYAGFALAEYAHAGYSGDAQTIPRGQAESMSAAEKAVQLDANLAEAYAARGYLRGCYSWDWNGAESDFVRALSLNPADDSTHERYARLLASLGRLDEAIAIARKPIAIDPLSSRVWYVLGRLQAAHGDFADARRSLQRALEITPGHAYAPLDLGLIALLEGDPAAAREEFLRSPVEPFQLTGIAMAEHDLGHVDASHEALAALTSRHAEGYAYQIAEVFAWRGENDSAFEWLDRASAQRDAGLQRLKYDPSLRRLHADPRYAALLRRLNLPA